MILPQPGAFFEWRQTPFGPTLVCLPLEDVARHLFTTRLWSLGSASAHPGAWTELAGALDVQSASMTRLRQVHGRDTVIGDHLAIGDDILREADIVLTRDPSRAIAVQAADCVPLLIADSRLGVVAAAHAGWRGLVQRVPDEAVKGLVRTYGSRPEDLLAAIGPSIGACCYEVGTDVVNAFVVSGFTGDERRRWFAEQPSPSPHNPSMPGLSPTPRPGHAYFDGWACAQEQLVAAGLLRTRIFSAGLCTASHPDTLCSYRRDGQRAGRMAGAIRASVRA